MLHCQSKQNKVITGIGLVSPLGNDQGEFWDNLGKGTDPVKRISLFDTKRFKVHKAAQIEDQSFGFKEDANILMSDRTTLFIASALLNAVKDAGINLDRDNAYEAGIFAGLCSGSIEKTVGFLKEVINEHEFASPSLFPFSILNAPSSRAALLANIKSFFKFIIR